VKKMILEGILFFIFLALLAKASDFTVDNLIEIAKLTKIEEWAIGFLLLAMVTSLPEASLSILSVLENGEGIPIGVAFGSILVNIGIALGLGGLLYGVKLSFKSLRRIIDMLFISAILVVLISTTPFLTKISGILLLILFVVFAMYSLRKKLTLEKLIYRPTTIFEKIILPFKLYKHLFYFAIGGISVVILADLTVKYGITIASALNIPNVILAGTAMAFGSSIPEIVTTISSLKKKKYNLAIGNLIGSNFILLTFIIGIPALFTNVFVESSNILIAFSLLMILLCWFFLGERSRGKLEKTESIILLSLYFIYLIVFLSSSFLKIF